MPLTRQNKLEFWNSQQPIFEKIYAQGMNKYVQQNRQIKQAFGCNDGCLCCIDEGITGQEHLAGAGILWEDFEELKRHLSKAKVKKIFSHSNCGAAKLYAEKNNLDVNNSDQYGKDFAKHLASELGISWEHVEENQLHRPNTFHIARIIYYDATNHFDYSRSSGFPPGFEVSRAISDKHHALEEVRFCASVILDENNGFGDLVNEDNPIIICPIANEDDKNLNRSTLTEEIANLLPSLNAEFGKVFMVSGFTAPKSNFLDKISLPHYFRNN